MLGRLHSKARKRMLFTVNTDRMAGFTDEGRAALAEETPVERLGEPDEIARTMVFLADEASGYITGQVLGVNGGLVI